MFPRLAVCANALLAVALAPVSGSLLAQGCAGGMDITGNECNLEVALQQPPSATFSTLGPPGDVALPAGKGNSLVPAVLVDAGEASVPVIISQPRPTQATAVTEVQRKTENPPLLLK